MTETNLQFEISLLIPGLTHHEDGCLARLEDALRANEGIRKVHVKNQQDPMVLCVHYDPDAVDMETIRALAAQAGAGISSRYHHATLPVEGMDCSDCVVVLEHGLRRTKGVLTANVNYAAQTLHLEYDAKNTNRAALEKRVQQLGYRVPASGARQWASANREILRSAVGGLLLLAAWLGEGWGGFPPALYLPLYALAFALSGWEVLQHAWHALKERRPDTDLLMVAAAAGAVALGEFAEGGLLLFLFGLGHALEERAVNRARDAVRSLGKLMPKTALVRRNGQEMEVPIDEIQLDEVAILRPGVRVPVDGQILMGSSAVDQSPVTGEAAPVDKAPGDAVYAGSVNGEGALEVRVSRLARDSTLARVMHMVEEAQGQKSRTQQLTERFMGWFVPAVLVGAVLLIAVPPLLGVPFRESFLRAMTLLVAASPCALALGTPSAVLAGVARAARGGVLVKGGMHLENLGQLRAVAFDKTGTITRGKPELTDVALLDGSTREQVLALAAAVESRSAHPLAQAVVRAAQTHNLNLPEVSEVESVTGRGIRAQVAGRAVWAGSPVFFAEAGIAVPESALSHAAAFEDQGKTAMLVWHEPHFVAVLAVADVVRGDARAAVAGLRSLGIQRTIMLTGDNPRAAAYIASQAGIDDVQAGLLPEDKLRAVRDLVARHGSAAMVGDGVNDAPALAHATVGVAMGGAGTDVALETADVALIGDDLRRLPFALGLGRATRRVIVQNLVIALGVIGVLMAAAVMGWASIGAAVFFHEGSTVLVALNALRLLGYQEA